jgi:flagellar basal-body rod protein FlgF
MYKGFYTLASGMLTENRNLNVVSNNMTNVSTPGYKSSTMVSSTFQEEMVYRYGNKNRANPTQLGESSMIVTAQETITDYTQAGFDITGDIYDFGLSKPGFFQIQRENGTVYTRNGSFILDEEGYLSLPRVGRVLGQKGPIRLENDNFQVDSSGNIIDGNGVVVDQLAIVDFADYTQLTRAGEGLFQANGGGTPVTDAVMWKALERSNVDTIREMTNMMSSQRALQSAAQILKMYDQIMQKSTTEIGRV